MAIFNETMVGGINAKDCTADASKILNGYTAAVGKEIVTGTMPDNGNVDSAIVNGVLKEGYTSGGTIANLEEGNIKDGVTIAGKTGSYKATATSGTFTPSSNLTSVTINHGLGRVPTLFAFYCLDSQSGGMHGFLYANINGEEHSFMECWNGTKVYTDEAYNYMTVNASSVTMKYRKATSATYYFVSGRTYYWYAI